MILSRCRGGSIVMRLGASLLQDMHNTLIRAKMPCCALVRIVLFWPGGTACRWAARGWYGSALEPIEGRELSYHLVRIG